MRGIGIGCDKRFVDEQLGEGTEVFFFSDQTEGFAEKFLERQDGCARVPALIVTLQ